jgi:hypothetical protein
MKNHIIFRIASILLSVAAILLLGWLWQNGYKDYSFIPLLLVAIALVCLNFYKSSK